MDEPFNANNVFYTGEEKKQQTKLMNGNSTVKTKLLLSHNKLGINNCKN